MFRSSLFCFADSMKMYMFTEIINYIFLIGGATLQHYQVPTEVQLPPSFVYLVTNQSLIQIGWNKEGFERELRFNFSLYSIYLHLKNVCVCFRLQGTTVSSIQTEEEVPAVQGTKEK